MIRQALNPDYYPEMRMGNPKIDGHVNHCVDSIRQSLMCSADISTIVWQWDEGTQNTTLRGNVAHKCRNFNLIREWAHKNMIGRHFDDKVHIKDDIDIPVYRADGSVYFP
ncbi:hypothetical protein D9619_003931 [Psilocybe cf. subviscida]|uniref:Uncharacterized protein n=1 Tax=Psilocybe cf. subviscida TaxID=2480587 RepID=A0A8H5BRZ6_9AGAR|nr:hypothetical protein D9619_003931 [Psilocybe cf. subviscida]